jgi:RimJ/RimL family protein N-acetyltransferase
MLDVQPIVLEGQIVRLEPMGMQHLEGFQACIDLETFKYFAATAPISLAPHNVAAYMEKMMRLPNVLPFTVLLQSTGEVVGSTSYMDIRPPHMGLEIGMTWYAEQQRGTKVNPECKFLLLRHAFESLGCVRVQLKTDGRNLQSQAAISKLGAKLEGTLRKHMIMYDGFVRDTVMYSILADEWPEVKAGLLARLG